MAVVKINEIPNKKLLDAVCYEFMMRLAPIEWIDRVFGKSERGVKKNSKGRLEYFPYIHDDAGEYHPLIPDDSYGNFLFFVANPINAISGSERNSKLSTQLSIIVFGNLDKTYADEKTSIENFKSKFLEEVEKLSSCRTVNTFKRLRISEQVQNVYKEFTLDEKETKTQFLMFPYFAIRVDLEISYLRKNCQNVQVFEDQNNQIKEPSEKQNEDGSTSSVEINEIGINQNGFRYKSNRIAIWQQNVISKEWIIEDVDGTVLKAQKGKFRIDNYGKYLNEIIEDDQNDRIILKWKFPISGETTIQLDEPLQEYEEITVENPTVDIGENEGIDFGEGNEVDLDE